MRHEKIKTAFIGCGRYPYRFLYDYTKDLPFFLCGISDEPETMRTFAERYAVPAQYTDYKELLVKEKPEFVIVFSPQNQFAIVSDCLRAGANVFCERPVTSNLEEARQLVSLQEKTNRAVMVRLNRRFTPSFRMVKQVMETKEFGAPTMYLAKYHAQPYTDEKTFLWYHVIHHLDAARYLLGELELLAVDRVAVDDTRLGYNILFRSEKGCAGVLQTSSLQSGDYPVERVEITGNARNIMMDNIRYVEYSRPGSSQKKLDDISFQEGSDILSWKPCNAHLDNANFYGFDICFEYIANCIKKGILPDHNMSDTIKTLALVQKVEDMVLKLQ